MMFATVVPCCKEGIISVPCSLRAAFLAACCVTLLTPASSLAQDSVAQDSPDPDTREVSSYALTESGLAKFAQATTNLGPIAEQLAGDCDDSDEGKSDLSLDGQAAFITGIPGAAAAIESAGMPVREFVVFSWAVIQNTVVAWMLTQSGGVPPPGVSMANIEFYRAHEAELKRLPQLLQSDDCQNGEKSSDEQSSEDEDYTRDED